MKLLACRNTMFLLVVLPGCYGGPSRLVPPPVSSHAGDSAIEKYDANGNGTLDSKELSASPALKSALNQIDKNGDGELSAEEIDARVEEWRKSKVAITSVTTSVRLDGRPLEGAEVTFEPESLMGKATEPAKGTTNDRGMARIKISDQPEGRGVRPGFYRIRISKLKNGRESLPKKYVDGSELGIEVVSDSFDARNPVLNLTSH
jgi:EF hand